jgi:hypothetical protein
MLRAPAMTCFQCRPWTPRLSREGRPAAFSRMAGYNCAGADIRTEAAVDFWINLPLSRMSRP